jgi:hypothetical protein
MFFVLFFCSLYLFPIPVTLCWCEIRYKQCESERIAAEESSRKLGQQIAEKEVQNSGIEGDLRIEREWRTSLQETVVKDRDKISQLHQELTQLKSVASVSVFIFFQFVPFPSLTICIKSNILYGFMTAENEFCGKLKLSYLVLYEQNEIKCILISIYLHIN